MTRVIGVAYAGFALWNAYSDPDTALYLGSTAIGILAGREVALRVLGNDLAYLPVEKAKKIAKQALLDTGSPGFHAMMVFVSGMSNEKAFENDCGATLKRFLTGVGTSSVFGGISGLLLPTLSGEPRTEAFRTSGEREEIQDVRAKKTQ